MKSHEQELREELQNEDNLKKIQEDYTQADLEEHNRTLLDFAAKMTRSPTEMAQGDIQSLRDQGFSDHDILDAVHIIGYFNYSNRVMDSLGVEPEPID